MDSKRKPHLLVTHTSLRWGSVTTRRCRRVGRQAYETIAQDGQAASAKENHEEGNAQGPRHAERVGPFSKKGKEHCFGILLTETRSMEIGQRQPCMSPHGQLDETMTKPRRNHDETIRISPPKRRNHNSTEKRIWVHYILIL